MNAGDGGAGSLEWLLKRTLLVHQDSWALDCSPDNSDPTWWLGTPCTSHFPFLPFKLPGCEDHGTLVEVCWGHNTSKVTAPLVLFGRRPLSASVKYLPPRHSCPERALLPCLWPLYYTASYLPTIFWCDRSTVMHDTAAKWEHLVLPGAAFACSVTVAKGVALLKEILLSENLTTLVGFLPVVAGLKLPRYGDSRQEVWDKSAGNRQG